MTTRDKQITLNTISDSLLREVVAEYLGSGWVSAETLELMTWNGWTKEQANDTMMFLSCAHEQSQVNLNEMSVFFGMMSVVKHFLKDDGTPEDNVIPDLMDVGVSEEAAYATVKFIAFASGYDLTYLDDWSVIGKSEEEMPDFFTSSIH